MSTLWQKPQIIWKQYDMIEIHTAVKTANGEKEIDPYEVSQDDRLMASVCGRRWDGDLDVLADFDSPDEAQSWLDEQENTVDQQVIPDIVDLRNPLFHNGPDASPNLS